MPLSTPKTEYESLGVIYARYSSSGQREESIEGQLRDCRDYAARFGIHIVGEYCDRALTGTSDRRPEFQRMIRDSAKNQFSVVITWKNDRFARSRYDSAIYKAKLKQNGVRVLYAKESIPEGPEGIILESVMEGFAEYYSANLSQNVKRGNYDSALKRQTLGQRVYGLRQNAEKRFEPDPATAPIVQRIFTEYASGKPAKEIYMELNAEGHRTSRGNLFNKNSLRRILQNEKYIGVYRFMDIVDENGIPPIVEKDLFEKVQKMIEKHHQSPAAKKTDGGFLLTSKLYCGECGEPMTGDCGTGKAGKVYYYYTCNGRRAKKCHKERAPKKWIEDAIVAKLAEIVNDDDLIEAFADRFMEWQAQEQPNDVLIDMEQKLRKVNEAIKNNMSLVDSGFITDSVKSHLIELESQRASLEVGISKEKLDSNAPKLPRESVIWFLRRFRTEDQSDIGWRIYIIDTFLKAAYLYDDGRLLLHLNFSGDKNMVSLQIAEQAVAEGEPLCSDFAPSGVPCKKPLLSKGQKRLFAHPRAFSHILRKGGANMGNLVLLALLATLGTWFVTALGAATVVFFKSPSPRAMNLMLGFASGVMIAASFWSLLQPAIEQAEAASAIPAYLVATLGFLFGALFMWASDKAVRFAQRRTESTQGKRSERFNRIVMLILSITLHNIPEGLAVGVAFGSLQGAAFTPEGLMGAATIAVGISLQNFPEGAAVSVPLRREGYSRRKSFFLGQASGLVEPIAGVIGAVLVVYVQAIMPYALAFAAGAMILVAVHELIPECQRNQAAQPYSATMGIVAGFAVMMLLDVMLG